MDTDVLQGLQVTAIGMGLVFLTLIIVALVIWALDRVFRPKPEEPEEEAGAEEETAAPLLMPVTEAADGTDEAAAVMMAIALERKKAAAAIAVAVAVDQAQCPDDRVYVELPGETVIVTAIDPGPGTWSAYGRAKIMQQ